MVRLAQNTDIYPFVVLMSGIYMRTENPYSVATQIDAFSTWTNEFNIFMESIGLFKEKSVTESYPQLSKSRVYLTIFNTFKSHLNIILIQMPCSPKYPLPLRYSDHNTELNYHFLHSCCMPAHAFLFTHPNISWNAQTMRLHIMSPLTCYLTFLSNKHIHLDFRLKTPTIYTIPHESETKFNYIGTVK